MFMVEAEVEAAVGAEVAAGAKEVVKEGQVGLEKYNPFMLLRSS
jgi:hypothetical protein